MQEIKIGTVLKRLLQERRLSLKEISKKTLIPYSTLYTWYENRQPKYILKAQKLAYFLDLSLHQLLFDEEDRKNAKNRQTPDESKDQLIKGRFEITIKRIFE